VTSNTGVGVTRKTLTGSNFADGRLVSIARFRHHCHRFDIVDKTRGLRIAHLIESDGPGGAERMLATMAGALQAAGCDVLVVVPERGEGWLAEQLVRTGVSIEPFALNGPVSPASVFRLEALFRRYGIAVAHSHDFTMAVYGAFASWRARVGHVITMHGGRYYAQRWRRRLALRAAVAVSGHLVAVSAKLADQLRRDLWIRRSRVRTIPNGVLFTPVEASSLRRELSLSSGDRLLLAVGNLYPVKGHQYLLDALALLAPRFPQLHVAIAGRGELESSLLQRAQELRLADRVHLLGLRSDVANLLAGADVFVLPSLSEGVPLALLEAMAAARPIVASDVGEVPAVLDAGRAGLLVRPADATALAAALGRLLTDADEARRLATAAAARAAAEYGLLRMLERYTELYEDLLSQRDHA